MTEPPRLFDRQSNSDAFLAGERVILSYAGEFEVHLTVRTEDVEALEFRQWCEGRGFKCVRIVLSRGSQPEQPMATWRRRETDLSAVLEEAREHASAAKLDGHEVVRLKIETPLGNCDVPAKDEEVRDRDATLYFEHHLKLQREIGASQEALRQVCEQHRSHLSRNAFARVDSSIEHRFVTLRSYRVGAETSVRQVNMLLKELDAIGENVIEQESEYCVYDSNVDLDAGWLPEKTMPLKQAT